MEKIYLYLLNKNKKDLKIVTCLTANSPINATKLVNADHLGLNAKDRSAIQGVIDKNQKGWEVWMESAENYSMLRDKLKMKGIVVPPSPSSPMLELESGAIPKSNLIKLNKNKTMIRCHTS